MGYFSTSGRNLQTGSWLFFGNRKLKTSKPEVENESDEKRIQFCSVSPILLFEYFEQGRRQRLLKIFAHYVTVYGHTRTKMINVTLQGSFLIDVFSELVSKYILVYSNQLDV